ncbi:hypothetical protein PROFUN_03491 [Planoprotostelium fungivorum]|uniref:Kinesin motor domain-containing protein n=1 Tax=Planoprotostelium fungivorum TaxID=1890364 RepID=A0A2P6MNA1_9EUKA|nr:hypothetical protein PROFUN_03491 [Planoprotostelium fungivorum]
MDPRIGLERYKVLLRIKDTEESFLSADLEQRKVTIDLVEEQNEEIKYPSTPVPKKGGAVQRPKTDAENEEKDRRTFHFDRVFNHEAQQKDIFEEVEDLIDSSLEGRHTTIVTYGGKKSGKTFTMRGTGREPGLILRSLDRLFKTLNRDSLCYYFLQVTYVHIRDEEIIDLTDTNNRDQKREVVVELDKYKGATLGGGNQLFSTVKTLEEAAHLLNRGTTFISDNGLEELGSSVFTVHIQRKGKNPEDTSMDRWSRLHLVDLAAPADDEPVKSFERIVYALSSKTYCGDIDIEDSCLTSLLRDSLGGNSRTCIISHVSCEAKKEAHQTLLHTNRMSRLTNLVVTNQTNDDDNNRALYLELEALRTQDLDRRREKARDKRVLQELEKKNKCLSRDKEKEDKRRSEEMESVREEYEERLFEAQRREEEARERLEEEEEKSETLRSEICRMKIECIKARDERDDLKNVIEEIQDKLNAQKETMSQWKLMQRDSREKESKSQMEQEERYEELSNKCKSLEKNVTLYKKELDKEKEKNRRYEEEVELLKSRCEEESGKRGDEMNKMKKNGEEENKRSRQALRDLEIKLNAAVTEKAAIKQELEEMKDTLDLLCNEKDEVAEQLKKERKLAQEREKTRDSSKQTALEQTENHKQREAEMKKKVKEREGEIEAFRETVRSLEKRNEELEEQSKKDKKRRSTTREEEKVTREILSFTTEEREEERQEKEKERQDKRRRERQEKKEREEERDKREEEEREEERKREKKKREEKKREEKEREEKEREEKEREEKEREEKKREKSRKTVDDDEEDSRKKSGGKRTSAGEKSLKKVDEKKRRTQDKEKTTKRRKTEDKENVAPKNSIISDIIFQDEDMSIESVGKKTRKLYDPSSSDVMDVPMAATSPLKNKRTSAVAKKKESLNVTSGSNLKQSFCIPRLKGFGILHMDGVCTVLHEVCCSKRGCKLWESNPRTRRTST